MDDLNGQLRIACRYGDIDKVRSLIERGADVDSRDKNEVIALHMACNKGHTAIAIASLLIERGADVGSRDDDGRTALHMACWNGHTVIALLLIERGADVDSRDKYEVTALHMACNKGHTAIASVLIERGADVNCRNSTGQTALHWACSGGHTATASLLIERGADVDSRDKRGATALHKACINGGHTAIASLLIERGADVNSRNVDGQTALHRACSNGKKEAAILLIRSKADIYIHGNNGRAPLDHLSEWREELTQLYEEVNRDWLARRPFLLVLIGCNHIESESNEHNASKQTQSERESEGISDELRAIRDRVLENRDLLGYKAPGTGIFSFL